MKKPNAHLPLELAEKIADHDVQAAAKIAQLSKACNALLRSRLSKAKQERNFDRMIAQLFPFKIGEFSRIVEERDYRDGISFFQLAERWRSEDWRRNDGKMLSAFVLSLDIASVLCFFAEADELQYPLLYLFGEYRRLLGLHNIEIRTPPRLFVESYNGRSISSMRPPMLLRHFEREIAKTMSRHYAWRDFWFTYVWSIPKQLQKDLDGLIGDLSLVLEGMKTDRADNLMRFITAVTLSSTSP